MLMLMSQRHDGPNEVSVPSCLKEQCRLEDHVLYPPSKVWRAHLVALIQLLVLVLVQALVLVLVLVVLMY
jgi:hypothetical protein